MMAALTDKPQTYSSLIKVSFSHVKAKQMCIPDLGDGLCHGYAGTQTSSTYGSAFSQSVGKENRQSYDVFIGQVRKGYRQFRLP